MFDGCFKHVMLSEAKHPLPIARDPSLRSG